MPEYVNAKCDVGEQMVECESGPGPYAYGNPGNFDRNAAIFSLFIDKTYECQKYDHNPNYRQIAVDSHGFAKYCYNTSATFPQILLTYFEYYLLAIFITVIFELPIYLKFGYKSKDNIKQIILINTVTVVALNLFLKFFFTSYGGLIKIWLLELIVIIVEGLYLNKKLAIQSNLKSISISGLANIFSATIGYLVFNAILKSLKLA